MATVDLTRPLHKNFLAREFVCKCSGKYCGGMVHITSPLVTLCQILRNIFEQPVSIVSGVRCVRWNQACGGAADSQHLYGAAADIKIKGYDDYSMVVDAYKQLIRSWHTPQSAQEHMVRFYLSYCYMIKDKVGKRTGGIHVDTGFVTGTRTNKLLHPFTTDSTMGIF